MTQTLPAARQPARAATAAFIGTMIEWYDFYIYATAAALVFGELYFPSHDPFVSTMASFATFAVGFFARPLGGVIFGHLGDRIGRKKALMTTLMMMGVATVCVGLLPDYAQVGMLAPVLLVALRIVQGIAVGGEWGGAVLMAGEHAPQGRRTFFASFAQLGSPAGLILSLIAFRAVTSMDKADFLAWGWRLPFLASSVLLVVGILIRLGVNESPEFARVKEANRTVKLPVAEVFRSSSGLVLLCIGANTIGIAGVYFTNTFMIAYTTQYVGVSRSLILDSLFVVAIIQFVAQPVAAWIAERIGGARFLKLAALLAMLSPYPMFMLVQGGTSASLVAGIALAVVCMAGFYSVIAGFVSGVFPAHVRYSAISLAYQICGALAGGLTPLAGTWLAHRFTGQWWPLAVFYTCLAGISLLCIVALDARRAAPRSRRPPKRSVRTERRRLNSSGVPMKKLLEIDGARLWRSLTDMARIGATPRGGVRRLALTDDDRRGRDLFARWCRDAGMTVSVDAVGNLFARRDGADARAAPVLIGSHLDTQPEGGRFDGVYGVLAALELVRTLNDAGVATGKPLEIVSWTNEEGARFAPAMLGSAVFTGALPLDDALAKRDADGVALGAALDACGYRGTRPTGGAVDAYFEAHIEQGPVLEANGTTIGVVTGGQAIRWLDVTVTGVAAHAGTTPMPYRKDAYFASAGIALELERIVAGYAPRGLATIGQVGIRNASRNTIAGETTFTVDLRHHDDAEVDAMERDLRDACARIAAARGVRVAIDTCWRSPATPFDRDCVEHVAQAAAAFGYTNERIVSGAGHDAILLARRFPTAMVFIPCVDGLSHNEAEDALPDDVTRGTNVLLNAVLARAGIAAIADTAAAAAHDA